MYLRENHSHGLYSNDFVNIFRISGRKMMIVKVVLFQLVYFCLPESLLYLETSGGTRVVILEVAFLSKHLKELN